MTKKEFQIWLIENDFNSYSSLAEKLGVTSRTIQNYASNDYFPSLFVYALKGLEKEV